MIARLADGAVVQATYQRFLEALAEAGFGGDIAPDYANRTVLATDNSIYQRLPQAVLYPRDAADLEHVARLAGCEAFRDIVLTPRGGGTGTNSHEVRNRDTSERIYNLSWREVTEDPANAGRLLLVPQPGQTAFAHTLATSIAGACLTHCA